MFIFLLLLPYALRIASPATWRNIAEKLPLRAVHHCFAVTDAMDKTAKDILAKKKALLAQGDAAFKFEKQIGEGKDILSVLCASLLG